uniref:Uncharacterized protein n=1 Tax=Nelumbo nucifera TaxID=4432 RepID=A0A822Z9K1_NELNU|nr:TPA_asm: hypothetical protein HUJ06_014049 [Nelumbo nucifera]
MSPQVDNHIWDSHHNSLSLSLSISQFSYTEINDPYPIRLWDAAYEHFTILC